MKTNKMLIGIAALVPLMTTASMSSPSSIGPTGILNVPTAEVVPSGQTELMVAYDRPTVAGVGIDVLPIVNLEHGFNNAEIGVSFFNVRNYSDVKAFNAKYLLKRASKKSPAIAAGLIYLHGEAAETDLYLVATQRFGRSNNFALTGGLLYQKPSHVSDDNFTGMMGFEFGKPGKTSIGFDYVMKDIAAGSLYGATIRQPLTKNLTWQVGIGNHSRYFTSLTMQFGGK